MSIVGAAELTLPQVQARMLRYAGATKSNAWLSLGMGQGIGGNENRVSILMYPLITDAYFVVDSPPSHKVRRRQIGQTALFHLAAPLEPEKLFSSIDTAETFEITTLVIDETCAFPLKAVHEARIRSRGFTRSGEILNYFYYAKDWHGYASDDFSTLRVYDLGWTDASEEDVRRIDGVITQSLQGAQERYPGNPVYDY